MARYIELATGFETGRLDAEVASTEGSGSYTGSVSIAATGARTGSRCLVASYNASGSYITIPYRANFYTTYHGLGFGIKISSGTRNATATIYANGDASTGAYDFSLALDTSGNLLVRDRDEGTIRTITTPFTAGQWHYVNVIWQPSASVGVIEVFIDGTSQGEDTNQSIQDFSNQQTIASFGNIASASVPDVAFDDVYLLTSSGVSERWTSPIKLYYYNSTNSSATADRNTGGEDNTLDTGVWSGAHNIPWVTAGTSTVAFTDSAANTGTNALDDEGGEDNGGGPYGDSAFTTDGGTELFVYAIWEVSRGGGGGTPMLLEYGRVNTSITTFAVASYTVTDTIPTSPGVMCSSTADTAGSTFPDPDTHYAAQGIRKGSGGRDLECDNMAFIYAVLESTSSPLTVTCTTETLDITASNADINSVPLNVTCTTETLDITTSGATVVTNVKLDVSGATKNIKRYKGITTTVYSMDAMTEYGGSASDPGWANIWDGNTLTSCTFSSSWHFGRGISNVGPVSSTSAKPIAIEIRAYITGAGTVDIRAGWDWGNQRPESTKAAYDNLRGMAADVQPGGWTEWVGHPLVSTQDYYRVIGYNDWDDEGQTDYTEPLTWAMIRDRFIVAFGGAVGSVNVHAVEVRISEGESVLTSGYFNGTVTDVDTTWSNDANIADGSTSTWASTTSAGALTRIRIYGNSIAKPGSYDNKVWSVYVRARLNLIWDGVNESVSSVMTIYRDNGGSPGDSLGTVPVLAQDQHIFVSDNHTSTNSGAHEKTTSNEPFWSDWYNIWFYPSPDETARSWDEIPDFWIQFGNSVTGSDAGAELQVSKVEIAVISPPPNNLRKGGKAKTNRGVTGSTQSLTLTESVATVEKGAQISGATETLDLTVSQSVINLTRPVNGATQTLTLTESNATTTRIRLVTGSTATLDLTDTNATITVERNVQASTETLTLTDSDATVTTNVPRVVTATTEVLTLTNTDAVVNLERIVISTTETLDLTEQNATVNAEFAVDALTEPIELTNTNASVNSSRQVTSSTEALTLTDFDASVTRNHIITAVSESLELTNTNATVDASNPLEVTCTTEALQITDNDATVDAARSVAGTTETLQITDNDATLNATRSVSSATEILQITDNDATVTTNVPRVVTAATEVLTLADNDATVTTNVPLTVTGSTESLTLTDFDATTNLSRQVTGLTEILVLTDSNATIDAPRLVTCATETLTLTDSDATVTTNVPLAVTGVTETLDLTIQTGEVNSSRSVAASVEQITLTASPASSSFDKTVVCSIETVTLTDNDATLNAERGVQAVTENLDITANNAQVFKGVDLNVNGATEVLALADTNATVNRTLGVIASSESLVLTEQNATVTTNVSRVVTGTTETLSLTDTDATVNATSGVNAATEVLTLADNDATVTTNVPLVVTGTTETLALTDNDATVTTNVPLVVTGTTETLTLADNDATVSTSSPLVVTCTTEILTLADNDATVTTNVPLVVTGTTETLALVDNDATVTTNVPLIVTGTTEILALTDNDATVTTNVPLVVTGTTETLTLTDSDATVSTSVPLTVTGSTEVLTLTANAAQLYLGVNLYVNCSTELLTFIESQANVNATAEVTAVTETLTLTDSDATITRTRPVTGATEQLSLTTNAATIAITRGVIAASETLLLGVNNAIVFRGQNLDVIATTEQMSLQTQNASVLFSFVATGSTEVIHIATNVATLITSRVVPAYTEILVLTESQGLVYRVIPPSDAPNYIWVVPDPDPHIWVQETESTLLEGES